MFTWCDLSSKEKDGWLEVCLKARAPPGTGVTSAAALSNHLTNAKFIAQCVFAVLKQFATPSPASPRTCWRGTRPYPRQPNLLRPNGANRWGSRYVIPLFIVLYHQIIFDISPILLIIISINIPHTTWMQNMHQEKKNDYGNFFHFRAQKCI